MYTNKEPVQSPSCLVCRWLETQEATSLVCYSVQGCVSMFEIFFHKVTLQSSLESFWRTSHVAWKLFSKARVFEKSQNLVAFGYFEKNAQTILFWTRHL